MLQHRGSGLLLHITSLPGPYGIGELGPAALDFIDFLAEAGQRYWQFLPIGPGDNIHGYSPYMSLSAFGGSPLLISPDLLIDDQLLSFRDMDGLLDFSEYLVDFRKVAALKGHLLGRAYENFDLAHRLRPEFDEFRQAEAHWLEDYGLFMAIREQQEAASWHQWPEPLARRNPQALLQASQELEERILYFIFEQFLFFRQWRTMRQHAKEKGVLLIGDIPIYVGYDSVDVWAHQECFCLNSTTMQSTHVAGVPPDYFSETGQRWGNPLYRWTVARKANQPLYEWWRKRFQHLASVVDIVRIDHFRGFESYWEIPASEETAINGRWRKGPGKSFFKAMKLDPKHLTIIAEDLGIITPAVEKLRDDLGFPGMKILQFAFDSDEENLYLPHNFQDPNCVVYTGTHDNNTTLGWYLSDHAPPSSKERARRYANSRDNGQIHWDFVRMAFGSVANTAIVPMQDILGFGEDCRMNTPSTTENNWVWRCASRFLNQEIAHRLLEETVFYGRLAKTKEKPDK